MNSSLLAAYTIALMALLPACSPAGSQHSAPAVPPAKPPQLAKKLWMELLEQEFKDPQRYLAATGASYRGPQGQLVLQGHLVNTASFASYKEPVILVTWFSKSYKNLGTRKYPVHALIKAQDAVPFRLVTDAPANVVSVGLGTATAAAGGTDPHGLL